MVVRERPATANKPTKVRICLDPSTVNKAINQPVYPIPTLEENIHRFHQAKIFSVFDIKDAFQNIELTLESSLLTTTHTPWGRYRLTRLSFGIGSAPEEFQHHLHDVLSELEDVVNIADDIIVVGQGESLDLCELKGVAYLITVDLYNDFYEIDRLPTIQSSAVIQATKQHFSQHGIPLLTPCNKTTRAKVLDRLNCTRQHG